MFTGTQKRDVYVGFVHMKQGATMDELAGELTRVLGAEDGLVYRAEGKRIVSQREPELVLA
jgi:hypothetical protein